MGPPPAFISRICATGSMAGSYLDALLRVSATALARITLDG